jgi:predicted TIM-barrel fold metal-dependent hydrolase
LGTDYPFMPEPGVRATLKELNSLGLTDEERGAILGGDARRLFRRRRG